MNSYLVIMAGGGGTRFWPLSRKETPKQLLNLSGKEVMVNETIDRFLPFISPKHIFIVTNESQVKKMAEVTKSRIPSENILSEPSGRNTSACIGYAAMKIFHKYGDGVMVVTPSDAYVKDTVKYGEVLKEAIRTVEDNNGIVTIGITPTFAATGYGYIHYQKDNNPVKKVIKFVEKPNQELADAYFKTGEYVWNSGIFVWKVSTVLDKFQALLPDIYADLSKIRESFDSPKEVEVTNSVYPTIRSISIDYGVMEKSDDIWVIPAEFGWNDVGSFDMLNVLHEEDSNKNVCVGKVIALDSKNSVIYSSGKTVAVVGIDNLVVVETPDAIMVCPKDKSQDVKKIVDYLKEKKMDDLL